MKMGMNCCRCKTAFNIVAIRQLDNGFWGFYCNNCMAKTIEEEKRIKQEIIENRHDFGQTKEG